MTLASGALLTLVFGLVVFDWVTFRGKNRRALVVEAVAFLGGAFFIAFPDRATDLAHRVGIGRGVDFLLYPIVIWLTRETLRARRESLEAAERLTEVTRALAIAGAIPVGGSAPPEAAADHSAVAKRASGV
jgi:hypothetical protein